MGYLLACIGASRGTIGWVPRGYPLHGKRDQVIPFTLGQELYDGLRVPKQMFVCESGGHCEIPSVEGDRYYEAVIRFVTGKGVRSFLRGKDVPTPTS